MTMAQRVGVALIAAIVVAAAAAPWIAPNPPARQHKGLAFAPPMPPRIVHDGSLRRPFVYPLVLTNRLESIFTEDRRRPVPLELFAGGRLVTATGTPWLLLGGDSVGRDVFARVLDGARLSLGVAGLAVLATLLLGAAAGAVAGHTGGHIDRIISGVANFVIVLPVLYAVVTLRAGMPLLLETSTVFWTMAGVMAALTWPVPAKGVRGIVAVESRKPYAEAAYAAGAGPLRILLRHVLPAAAGHLAVQGLLLFPAFIFAEATLSFVGLGFAEPSASWGVMLRDAERISAMTEAPWLLAPGGAIVLTVVAVHLIAGGLDPRARSATRAVAIEV